LGAYITSTPRFGQTSLLRASIRGGIGDGHTHNASFASNVTSGQANRANREIRGDSWLSDTAYCRSGPLARTVSPCLSLRIRLALSPFISLTERPRSSDRRYLKPAGVAESITIVLNRAETSSRLMVKIRRSKFGGLRGSRSITYCVTTSSPHYHNVNLHRIGVPKGF